MFIFNFLHWLFTSIFFSNFTHIVLIIYNIVLTIFIYKRLIKPMIGFACHNYAKYGSPNMKYPTRKHSDDAGFDIYIPDVTFDELCNSKKYDVIFTDEYKYDRNKKALILKPGDIIMINTGIAYVLENGWHFIAKERGSTGSIGLSVRCGVNDNGYRGEVFIALNNTSNKNIILTKCMDDIMKTDIYAEKYVGSAFYDINKAIAQLVPVYSPGFNVTIFNNLAQLNITRRGEKKLGSSGH